MAMFVRNLCKNFAQLSLTQMRRCSAVISPGVKVPDLPIISTTSYINPDKMFIKPRQAWIESFNTVDEKKLGLISLHSDIFGAAPRVDIIHANVRWQRMYRFVDYKKSKLGFEMRGGKRKPWPQKGTGRARHGNTKSPLWKGGGRAHGPRGFKPHFYMLPFHTRIYGLTSALSAKLAQDDLHIVSNLDIPSDEPSFIEEMMEARNWGPSVLIIDTDDIFPEKISIATNEMKHVNLMPVYGLNVYSMLKHNTLILTERAAREIETKILYHLNRTDRNLYAKYKPSQR